MNEISNLDLAYVAGLADGEGWFTLIKRKQKTKGKLYINYFPQFGICNNNREVLEWVKVTVGLGGVYKKSRKGNRKQGWQYISSCLGAVEFTNLLFPFLKIKRLQAEILIKFQQTRGIREPFWQGSNPKEVTDLRMMYVNQIRQLNLRGRDPLELPFIGEVIN